MFFFHFFFIMLFCTSCHWLHRHIKSSGWALTNQFKSFALSFVRSNSHSPWVYLSVCLALCRVDSARVTAIRTSISLSFSLTLVWLLFYLFTLFNRIFLQQSKSECVVVEHTHTHTLTMHGCVYIDCAWRSEFYPIHIFCKHCFVYVWTKFRTRLRISQPYDMFEARLHAQTLLHFCVLFMCSVNEYNGTLTAYFTIKPRKSSIFFFSSLAHI